LSFTTARPEEDDWLHLIGQLVCRRDIKHSRRAADRSES
jgi:hypothetical protein